MCLPIATAVALPSFTRHNELSQRSVADGESLAAVTVFANADFAPFWSQAFIFVSLRGAGIHLYQSMPDSFACWSVLAVLEGHV